MEEGFMTSTSEDLEYSSDPALPSFQNSTSTICPRHLCLALLVRSGVAQPKLTACPEACLCQQPGRRQMRDAQILVQLQDVVQAGWFHTKEGKPRGLIPQFLRPQF